MSIHVVRSGSTMALPQGIIRVDGGRHRAVAALLLPAFGWVEEANDALPPVEVEHPGELFHLVGVHLTSAQVALALSDPKRYREPRRAALVDLTQPVPSH